MSLCLNRREFLQRSAAAGILVYSGCVSAFAADPNGPSVLTKLIVVSGEASPDSNPRSPSWIYIEEILRRAGLFFETCRPSDLNRNLRGADAILVLVGTVRLNREQTDLISEWVKTGGSLLGIGGTSGLRDVFGVASETTLSEGWIKVSAKDHPVTAGLRSSLHVFGGCALAKDTATVLAELEGGGPMVNGATILENRYGAGLALLIGPDLVFSVMHMQQGIPVLQDGRPAPDGLAPLNDNVHKAEDGSVLDWQKDRSPAEPGQEQIFLEPISDELREIVVRSILHLVQEQGRSIAMLWYWPDRLQGVAHMSHDTDGHDPSKADALLEVMNRCGIKSTWCILYPGGYPREFYRSLKEQDFEIALHYDAMSGGEKTSWSRENFLFQHRWLKEEAGVDKITTNKNHYTRWEGYLDLHHWCQEAGIDVDQTRGPSKKGTIGFPLGGSQPYFPLDVSIDKAGFLKTLEINLLTQDLVITCPSGYGPQLMDSAVRHHGVAHFLFHPAHIQKPGVAEALSRVVDYGRGKGIQWWTARQIHEWETKRRGVTGVVREGKLRLNAPQSLRNATVLLLKPKGREGALLIGGQGVEADNWNVYGFEFAALTRDLTGRIHADWRAA